MSSFVTFWELLIERHEQLVVHCQSQETCVATLQFYEEGFKCEKLGELRITLLQSFVKIVRYFFDMEPPMALVLSTLGRFFLAIVPTQRDFIDDRQLRLWLASVGVIVSKVTGTTKMTLTAQKALESVVSLLPVDRQFGLQIMRTFAEVLRETANTNLRIASIDLLVSYLSVNTDEADFVEYLLELKSLFSLQETEKLVQSVLSRRFQLYSDRVFELFESMGPKGLQRIAVDLRMFSADKQLKFIEQTAGDLGTLVRLWGSFCEVSSESFSRELFQSCGDKLLTAICRHLSMEAATVLGFLAVSTAPPRDIGAKQGCVKWQLFGILEDIFGLLNHSDRDIAAQASAVVGLVEAELGEILAD
jgi:hypothetical protein